MEYKTATIDDIIKDAKKNGRVKELKEIASQVDKNGTKINFLQLKRDYFEEFYPDDVPRRKISLNFWERIEAL